MIQFRKEVSRPACSYFFFLLSLQRGLRQVEHSQGHNEIVDTLILGSADQSTFGIKPRSVFPVQELVST